MVCSTRVTIPTYSAARTDVVQGFAEHIARYDHFFTPLAAAPSSLHITAFDQRGHGRTAHAPLTASSEQVIKWKSEGKKVKLDKNGKRVTGGWAKVMPDIEWFVKRESATAEKEGKKLFLWGFSMVSMRPFMVIERQQTRDKRWSWGTDEA